MIGGFPVQLAITFILYGFLYLSVQTVVFAKCGGIHDWSRLIRASRVVRREMANVALLTGLVHTTINIIIFAAYLKAPEDFARKLGATAFPMAPALALALVTVFFKQRKQAPPFGNAGKNKKRKSPLFRYALGIGGIISFIFLYAIASRIQFSPFTLFDPVSLLLVLLGFGLGLLGWLPARKHQPKDLRKIYRPGFVSTFLFFYSVYTAAGLFLLINGSLDNPFEIGKWTAVFLLSILYYGIVLLFLRGSRISRFCRSGLWKEWNESTWQKVIMPIALIVLTAEPYMFFAWFLR